MRTILIVEDDTSMLRTLEKFFQHRFKVLTASNGKAGLEKALSFRPEAVVLDISLPDMDGITVCKEIRRGGCSSPVLFLTAHDTEITKLVGFDVGGDDYVTKPASLLELEARVEAILRRASAGAAETTKDVVSWDDVVVDLSNHRAQVGQREVRLSAKEVELLRLLIRRRGQVVSRRELLSQVWNYAGDVGSRTLDTHIRSLRKKLSSSSGNGSFIETVHGVGYRFAG